MRNLSQSLIARTIAPARQRKSMRTAGQRHCNFYTDDMIMVSRTISMLRYDNRATDNRCDDGGGRPALRRKI
jgi:hypothetical protein